MIKYIEIKNIKGADYNPRKINETKLNSLAESIKQLGFCLPIIVNAENNTIVAGHQRTKTAWKLGMKRVPAVFLKDITLTDEINFNQLHNGAEFSSSGKVKVNTEHYAHNDFVEILPEHINVSRENINASVVQNICRLIQKYGNVFSSVIAGDIIVFQDEYAYACKVMNIKCNAFILPKEKFESALNYFSKKYGEFSYENLSKNTFVQGLAQMHRTTKSNENVNKVKNRHRSVLYEELVYPFLKENQINSILDFGCGKGAYVKELNGFGYNAIGVEFYNNNGKSINATKGNSQIDLLIQHLRNDKKFDLVVCDSVLNSVDSVNAEESVMKIINLFTKDIAFVSGITLKKALYANNSSKSARNSKMRMLDDNNFSATFRNGNWYYQHYHNKEDVEKLAFRNGFMVMNYRVVNGSWKAKLKKIRSLTDEEYIDAIDFEFNLPLPNGKSYNRHNDVKAILGY